MLIVSRKSYQSTNWSLPLISDDGGVYEHSETEAFVSLPKRFYSFIMLSNLNDIDEDKVDKCLRKLLKDNFPDVNLKRLQKIIRFKASLYDLSAAELDFVTLSSLSKVSLNHYVRLV